MAEGRNGTATPSSSQSPGTFYQNELGTALPEPFPAPFPAMAPPSLQRLQREYVAGGGWAWYGQVARTLPNAIDDVTADFGDDLYERMMYDPQISAVTQVFKASILETGLNLTSAVPKRSYPDFDLAAEIADEATRMMAEFDGNLDDILYDLLNCVAFGNKVAEQTYRIDGSIKNGRPILVLDKLKVRPRRSTVFAVDIYLNVVGLLIRVPPNASPWSSTMMFGPEDEPFNLIPPHKFVINNFRVRDNDPRGNSILRPAYAPWWRKQQIIPEYLKYLSQFAGPSLYGIVGENATPQPDPNNPGSFVTPEQVLLAALQQFRNGTAGAFAFGTTIKEIAMTGDGAAFLRAIDHCDQQITKGVLTQELATEEGKHMARAAAEVHQDVLDTLVRQGKLGFARQFRNQLFKRWVTYNWGASAAHLAPVVGLGRAILREQPALWTSVGQMQNAGYLAPSQYQRLDEMVGLPVRDEDEVMLALETPNNGASGATNPGSSSGGAPTPPAPPKKLPLPAHLKDKDDTTVKPSIPDMVPVRPHVRAKPGRGKGVVSVTNGLLPSPSPSSFG